MFGLRAIAAVAAVRDGFRLQPGILRFFSDNYAHIGQPHRLDHPLTPYDDADDPAVRLNLMCLKWAAWLLYVTSELVFFDVGPSRYWRRLGPNAYAYDPSPDERRWLAQYLGALEDQGRGPRASDHRAAD